MPVFVPRPDHRKRWRTGGSSPPDRHPHGGAAFVPPETTTTGPSFAPNAMRVDEQSVRSSEAEHKGQRRCCVRTGAYVAYRSLSRIRAAERRGSITRRRAGGIVGEVINLGDACHPDVLVINNPHPDGRCRRVRACGAAIRSLVAGVGTCTRACGHAVGVDACRITSRATTAPSRSSVVRSSPLPYSSSPPSPLSSPEGARPGRQPPSLSVRSAP